MKKYPQSKTLIKSYLPELRYLTNYNTFRINDELIMMNLMSKIKF